MQKWQSDQWEGNVWEWTCDPWDAHLPGSKCKSTQWVSMMDLQRHLRHRLYVCVLSSPEWLRLTAAVASSTPHPLLKDECTMSGQSPWKTSPCGKEKPHIQSYGFPMQSKVLVAYLHVSLFWNQTLVLFPIEVFRIAYHYKQPSVSH